MISSFNIANEKAHIMRQVYDISLISTLRRTLTVIEIFLIKVFS